MELSSQISLLPLTHSGITTKNYLPELPPSPWRSIGRRLDYRAWQERDRFLELDAAIASDQLKESLRNALRPRVDIDGPVLFSSATVSTQPIPDLWLEPNATDCA